MVHMGARQFGDHAFGEYFHVTDATVFSFDRQDLSNFIDLL
jgi:hypothetical protein